MTERLQKAIEAGQAAGKLALFHGCWDRPGHFLHRSNGMIVWDPPPQFPWDSSLMDGGLLCNGKRPDVYDGKVFWTAGGLEFWYAFFWWDRSGDRRGASNSGFYVRGASNSGFYVRGFGWPEIEEAFNYACKTFPHIVQRQRQPLILQV